MDERDTLEEPIEDEESSAGMRDDRINISDVIEVIETDPDFSQPSEMFNGGLGQRGDAPPQASRRPAPRGTVHIVEQPAPKALRFRYECEGRSAGSIPGVSSTPESRTYPTIQIVGYAGKAVVVVSCVTKDPPYRPHPHNLVGREACKKGVCTMETSPETMSVTFSNLGIQCVKKKDIESALRVREEIRVDPFRTGFSHRNQPTSIDLNAVRLCFQAFVQDKPGGNFNVPLPPVVSDPIYDKKAMCDLVIVKLSDCVVPANGGSKDVLLFCEKVAKEDIQVRFFEMTDGVEVWQAFGEFQPSQVHKQTGIWFRPPKYRNLDITEPAKVFIQLRRPSDGATSEALHFEFAPLDADMQRKHKRTKFERDPNSSNVLLQIQEQERNRMAGPSSAFLNIPMEIKAEPRDPSPMAYQSYGGSPMYTPSISPHYFPALDQMAPTPPQYQNVAAPSTSSSMAADIGNLQPIPAWPSNNLTMDSGGLSNLFDLDSNRLETLNSSDLNFLGPNLSETLSLSDVPRQDNPNMTDSLTKLGNTTYDRMMDDGQ